MRLHDGMGFDGMMVSPAYLKRVQDMTPPAMPATLASFAGVTIYASPHVPDGFAVLCKDGVPVDVIDLRKAE